MENILIVRIADKDGEPVAREIVLGLNAEKSEARARAARYLETIEDGDFEVAIVIGEPLVSRTKRVVSGVKATRAPREAKPNGKPVKAKKRGLNPAAKITAPAD